MCGALSKSLGPGLSVLKESSEIIQCTVNLSAIWSIFQQIPARSTGGSRAMSDVRGPKSVTRFERRRLSKFLLPYKTSLSPGPWMLPPFTYTCTECTDRTGKLGGHVDAVSSPTFLAQILVQNLPTKSTEVTLTTSWFFLLGYHTTKNSLLLTDIHRPEIKAIYC